jgi:hypothetical protein
MIEHGLFFVNDNVRLMSVERAVELALTTKHEIFDLNKSLMMDYELYDEEVDIDIDA